MRIRNLISRMTSTVVTWATAFTHVFQNLTVNGTLTVVGQFINGLVPQSVNINAAGITVTPTGAEGMVILNVSTNNAFTLAVPSATQAIGTRLVVLYQNTSGGAGPVMTIAAAYRFSAFTAPANGAWRALEFICVDGTVWAQISPAGVDLT